ncbi:MAG TPA: ClbS/DfsB family four-helix bundle protein, partial [Ktedonobacteraceae bacterium]
ELHATYHEVVALVESMSNEGLNEPLDWMDGRPISASIEGNTYGHYQEHIDHIERWLVATQK